MDQILEALVGIEKTWSCARQVREVCLSAMKEEEIRKQGDGEVKEGKERQGSAESFDFMKGLVDCGNGMGMEEEIVLDGQEEWGDLGFGDGYGEVDFDQFLFDGVAWDGSSALES